MLRLRWFWPDLLSKRRAVHSITAANSASSRPGNCCANMALRRTPARQLAISRQRAKARGHAESYPAPQRSGCQPNQATGPARTTPQPSTATKAGTAMMPPPAPVMPGRQSQRAGPQQIKQRQLTAR